VGPTVRYCKKKIFFKWSSPSDPPSSEMPFPVENGESQSVLPHTDSRPSSRAENSSKNGSENGDTPTPPVVSSPFRATESSPIPSTPKVVQSNCEEAMDVDKTIDQMISNFVSTDNMMGPPTQIGTNSNVEIYQNDQSPIISSPASYNSPSPVNLGINSPINQFQPVHSPVNPVSPHQPIISPLHRNNMTPSPQNNMTPSPHSYNAVSPQPAQMMAPPQNTQLNQVGAPVAGQNVSMGPNFALNGHPQGFYNGMSKEPYNPFSHTNLMEQSADPANQNPQNLAGFDPQIQNFQQNRNPFQNF
jgi:hypothetical protein